MNENTTSEQSTTGLVAYDAMIAAIDRCYQVDEVKDLRDKAMAIEYYARQALNVDAERKAIEVRIRAERRAGQLLAEMERSPMSKGGDLKSESAVQTERPISEFQEAKKEANISDTQAKRWQKLAAMPHEDFERKLHNPLVKPTTSGLLNGQKQDVPRQAPSEALWLWGRLLDFERQGYFQDDINRIYGLMSPEMRAGINHIIPRLSDWLFNWKGEK